MRAYSKIAIFLLIGLLPSIANAVEQQVTLNSNERLVSAYAIILDPGSANNYTAKAPESIPTQIKQLGLVIFGPGFMIWELSSRL